MFRQSCLQDTGIPLLSRSSGQCSQGLTCRCLAASASAKSIDCKTSSPQLPSNCYQDCDCSGTAFSTACLMRRPAWTLKSICHTYSATLSLLPPALCCSRNEATFSASELDGKIGYKTSTISASLMTSVSLLMSSPTSGTCSAVQAVCSSWLTSPKC